MTAPIMKEHVETRPWWKGGDVHKLSSDGEALRQRFPEMKAISGPPTLYMLNLCGTTVYGARDGDRETQTCVVTIALVILLVPVAFLGAYRVRRSSGKGWFFLGRVPLSRRARLFNQLSVPLGIIAVTTSYALGVVVPCVQSSDPVALLMVGVITVVVVFGVLGIVLLKRHQARIG